MTRVRENGAVVVRNIRLQTSRTLAGATAYIVEEEKIVLIFDHRGTLIIEHLGVMSQDIGDGSVGVLVTARAFRDMMWTVFTL